LRDVHRRDRVVHIINVLGYRWNFAPAAMQEHVGNKHNDNCCQHNQPALPLVHSMMIYLGRYEVDRVFPKDDQGGGDGSRSSLTSLRFIGLLANGTMAISKGQSASKTCSLSLSCLGAAYV